MFGALAITLPHKLLASLLHVKIKTDMIEDKFT